MNVGKPTLFICTTCRRSTTALEEPSDGGKLYGALEALLAQRVSDNSYTITGIACMNGCERACTAALSAPGKPTYFFGDLEPNAASAEQALELIERYRDKPNGVLLPSRRPPAFRDGILAKIPPIIGASQNETGPAFDKTFNEKLVELLKWRRDVRRFRSDPVPTELIEQLLEAADLAPSVGLSQPWRFVIVDDAARREAVRKNFEASNAEALASMHGERASQYARLKLAGLDEAPRHFAVFSEPAPEQGHGLGRQTMPETTNYSAVMAVHTFWIAARAIGLGLGWVSILDPTKIAETLDVPPSWNFIGYFCLGYSQKNSETPALEQQNWEHRHLIASKYLRR